MASISTRIQKISIPFNESAAGNNKIKFSDSTYWQKSCNPIQFGGHNLMENKEKYGALIKEAKKCWNSFMIACKAKCHIMRNFFAANCLAVRCLSHKIK